MVYLTALQKRPDRRVTPISNNDVAIPIGGGNYYEPMNSSQTSRAASVVQCARRCNCSMEQSVNLVTRLACAKDRNAGGRATTAAAFHFHDALPHVYSGRARFGGNDGVACWPVPTPRWPTGGREVIADSLIDSVQDRNGRIVVLRSARIGMPRLLRSRQKPPMVMTDHARARSPIPITSVFQLIDNDASGVVHGRHRASRRRKGLEPGPIAGKTGTTPGLWPTHGFRRLHARSRDHRLDRVTTTTDSLGRATRTGGVIAAPIWHDFMADRAERPPSGAVNFLCRLAVTTWRNGTPASARHIDGVQTGPVPPMRPGGLAVAVESATKARTDRHAPSCRHPRRESTTALGGLY